MKQKLLKKLHNELKKATLAELSLKIGVPYASLWRMVHNGTGSMKNWEKVEAFFRNTDTTKIA